VWGHPFVGFGCGGVDIGKRKVSSRSACSGTSGGGAEWRDERCCSAATALLTARLVAVPMLTQQGRWDPTLSLSGREDGTRVRRRSLLVNIGVRPFLLSQTRVIMFALINCFFILVFTPVS
jgi:hypothetical protein